MPIASHARLSRTLGKLFASYAGPPFAIRLWDGWLWNSPPNSSGPASPGPPTPACTIVVATPQVAQALALGASQVALAEAFIHKQIEIEGDLFAVFDVAEHLLNRPQSLRNRLFRKISRLGYTFSRRAVLGPRHSRRRDRSSIAAHYDQPVDFFRPWLGPTLAYSCAYFRDCTGSLDDAQQRKLDLICRKLRLQPGHRFLDIGCGWGSLILHAAARYGAHAEGITLSREQAKVAQQRIADANLGSRCQVRFQDYRDFDPAHESFDRIASVGMAEHVGLKNLPGYFSIAYRLLKPGGVFLNHAIARSAAGPAPRGHDSFIARYVFPDGELVTPAQTIAAAESAGFEVRDIENLREHYGLTLRRWVQAFQQSMPALLEHVPETTCRIWLLYMAGCAEAFRRGDIGVYQLLLSRPENGDSHLPLTREDWYSAVQPTVPGPSENLVQAPQVNRIRSATM